MKTTVQIDTREPGTSRRQHHGPMSPEAAQAVILGWTGLELRVTVATYADGPERDADVAFVQPLRCEVHRVPSCEPWTVGWFVMRPEATPEQRAEAAAKALAAMAA